MSRTARITAVLAGALLAPAALATAAAATSPGTYVADASARTTGVVCTAELRVTDVFPNGYLAEVHVTAGERPLNGWTTSFTMPPGESIHYLWKGLASGRSGDITVTSGPWNEAVPAGQSVSYGFISSGALPTDDVTCSG